MADLRFGVLAAVKRPDLAAYPHGFSVQIVGFPADGHVEGAADPSFHGRLDRGRIRDRHHPTRRFLTD
jgi:hypothetical protein